jgi:oligosaccharyltransferase complex subunit beta
MTWYVQALLGYRNLVTKTLNQTYTIELSEYHEDHFIPFEPPVDDAVQLEFTMLSPFHRLPLKAVGGTDNSTLYSTSFTLPDQHGIFSFCVNYKRPFLTYIYEKRDVSVRHFAHDEWPRSWRISGAWTWISGIWVTIAGWVAFVAVWLWSASPKSASHSKKTQ